MTANKTLLTGIAALGLASAVFAAGPRPSVTLKATPGSRAVARGSAARYAIVLERTARHGRRVNVQVADVARGVRVSWELQRATGARRLQPLVVLGHRVKLVVNDHTIGRATLVLRTTRRTPLGNFRPLVSARGAGTHAKLRLRLTVRRPRRPTSTTDLFGLSGRLAGPLSPGTTQPLEITIVNPVKFPLRLVRPGCRA